MIFITNIPVVFGWPTFLISLLGIFHAGRDDDLHGQLFVDWRYIIASAAIVEDADHGFLLALHHADDPAFSLAVVAETAHFHQYLVAVHGIADIRRWNKYVTLQLALGTGRQRAGFGDDEAIAVAMHT